MPVPTGPVDPALLPRTSVIGADGRLSIGGCDVLDLVAEEGTPLFVYDEAHLRAACREAVEAWGDGVAYATKAFLCVAMARLAHEEGMCLDVSTGGELHVALTAGVPADRLVLHGNNKSTEELAAALSVGVGRIVVDSFDEIDRIEALVADPPLLEGGPDDAEPPCGGVRRSWPASPRGSRSTPTSSSAPVRRTRSSGSAWGPTPPPGPSHGWPTWTGPACSSSWASTPTWGARSSRSSPSRRPSRSWPSSSRRSAFRSWWWAADWAWPTSTVRRRRPWPSGRTRCGAPAVRLGSRTRYGSPPSPVGRSWPPPASPSTGWGRSRRYPATAPTWRWTGG